MASDKLKKARTIILWVSPVLYVVSLTQSAFTYNDFDGTKAYSSFSLLLGGALAVLGGAYLEWIIWWANPLYLIGLLLLFRNQKTSTSFAFLATVASLCFLSWDEILAAEDGRMAPIVSLNAGYWLWLSSQIVLTVGSFCYFYYSDKPAT